MKKMKLYLILIILLSVFLITKNYVSANGGPTSREPSEMSSIFFDENTNISLVEETILFSDIQDKSQEPEAKVS